jgi:hypothetical protein
VGGRRRVVKFKFPTIAFQQQTVEKLRSRKGGGHLRGQIVWLVEYNNPSVGKTGFCIFICGGSSRSVGHLRGQIVWLVESNNPAVGKLVFVFSFAVEVAVV